MDFLSQTDKIDPAPEKFTENENYYRNWNNMTEPRLKSPRNGFLQKKKGKMDPAPKMVFVTPHKMGPGPKIELCHTRQNGPSPKNGFCHTRQNGPQSMKQKTYRK